MDDTNSGAAGAPADATANGGGTGPSVDGTGTNAEGAALVSEFQNALDPNSPAALQARVGELEGRVASLEKENEALSGALDKEKGKSKSLRSKAAEPTPRKLGPIADKDQLDRDALRKALDGAESVEIAFSDGKKEVKGLGAIEVQGKVWKDHPTGLLLNEPVDIYGPARDASAFSIAGISLLIDGKPVAYTAREPLSVPAGQHVKLENDIIFAAPIAA